MGEESYELDIRNHVTIEASTVKGVFWGTRTLLQMIHNQPFGLMKGKALDYPQYAHRGLMIDVARKFFHNGLFAGLRKKFSRSIK